jgi:hypothetical protein
MVEAMRTKLPEVQVVVRWRGVKHSGTTDPTRAQRLTAREAREAYARAPWRGLPVVGFYFWVCVDGWGYRIIHEADVLKIE